MIKIVKVYGVGILEVNLQDVKYYNRQSDIGYLKEYKETNGKIRKFCKTPIYADIKTKLMLIEPQQIRISKGVYFSFMLDDCWQRISSQEILKIEEDVEDHVLMVTTYKGGKKTLYFFLLEDALNLECNNKVFQPTKFRFQDYIQREGIIFDKEECLKSYRNLDSDNWIFNNCLYHYVVEMIHHGMSHLSLEDFKMLLNEPAKFVGLCDVCQNAILEEEREKHNCESCSNPCKMKCSLCREVMYCDQDCQKSDWEKHKTICAKLARDRADRRRVASQFEEFLEKRMKVSPKIKFEKFYKLQKKKIFFESRAIMFFHEQIPEMELNEVD